MSNIKIKDCVPPNRKEFNKYGEKMAKRRPDSQLTQSNWDDEIQQDEFGQFQKADAKEMEQRRILAPKRRLAKSSDQNDSNGSATKAPSVFSGFSLLSKPSTTGVETSKMAFSFGGNPQLTSSNTFGIGSTTSALSSTIKPTATDCNSNSKFESKLFDLNNAFLDCIKKHIESKKLCIFSPIFKDYDRYVAEMKVDEGNGDTKPHFEKSAEITSSAPFSFNTKVTVLSEPSVEEKTVPTVTNTTSLFSFSKPTATISAQPGSFSFGSAIQQASSSTKQVNGTENTVDEENDEPPKVEFVPVVEENIYSKRCKVFVKDDCDYKDRGTGTLYLKMVKDDKVQLLVRADTNLGNILLNILLSPGLPAKQLKNNVALVCIPTPEADPKPKSVLVRVKTEDDAAELLKEIQKHQN